MQPYSRPSNCVSDLITALMINPVFSADFIDSWSVPDATVELNDDSSYTLSRASGDTLFTCVIDADRFTIDEYLIITTGDVGRQLYNATFTWGISEDSVPYLEDLRIYGYSQFERGGVDFYNISVNGKSGIKAIRANHIRPDNMQQVYSVIAGKGVGSVASYSITDAFVFDVAGRLVYRTAATTVTGSGKHKVTNGMERFYGKRAATGLHTVVRKQKRIERK